MTTIPTNNPRPTFALDPSPMHVWNEVPGATYYRFKMTNQKTDFILWDKIIQSDDYQIVRMDEIFLKHPYPESNSPLNYGGPFLLGGEAYNSEGSVLSTSSLTIVLLDRRTQDAVKEFERILDLDLDLTNKEVRDLPPILQSWLKAKEAILVSDRSRSSFLPWGISHWLMNFEYEKVNCE